MIRLLSILALASICSSGCMQAEATRTAPDGTVTRFKTTRTIWTTQIARARLVDTNGFTLDVDGLNSKSDEKTAEAVAYGLGKAFMEKAFPGTAALGK